MSENGAARRGLIRQGDVLLVPAGEIQTDGEVESKRVADRHGTPYDAKRPILPRTLARTDPHPRA